MVTADVVKSPGLETLVVTMTILSSCPKALSPGIAPSWWE